MLNFYSSCSQGQPCGANSPREAGVADCINALIRGSGLALNLNSCNLANQMGIADQAHFLEQEIRQRQELRAMSTALGALEASHN